MATIIGDAQDLGIEILQGSRNVVRTSGGGIYVVAIDSVADPEAVAVWYSADGSSWAEKDVANRPAAAGAGDIIFGLSVAIDSNNLLHIFYYEQGLQYSYTTFATATDQWNGGNPASVEEVASEAQGVISGGLVLAITVDSNNKPHVVFRDRVTVHGSLYSTIYYSNKIGVGWKAAVEVAGGTGQYSADSPDITVNNSDIPLIAYRHATNNDIMAVKGDKNDADSFTAHVIDTSIQGGSYYAPSIAVDGDGNAWVAYCDLPGPVITIAKQSANWTDAWTYATDSDVGETPSLAIDGTDIYVFYGVYVSAARYKVCYNKYSSGSWSGEVELQNGSGRVYRPKARWALNNNYSYSGGIDYVFYDTSDLYWDILTITVPPVFKPQVIFID